jgi:hypothetical protein
MKKVKYRVGRGDPACFLPEGAMVDCYLVYLGNCDDGLLFMPANAKYTYRGKTKKDDNVPFIFLGREAFETEFWVYNSNGIVTLEYKTLDKNKV